MKALFPMKNIYLAGFMGAGKSTVGRRLASRLKKEFLDTDALIETHSGLPVAGIFQRCGEAYFRRLERLILKDVSRLESRVIALGGGAPLNSRSWKALRETGITIYLRVGSNLLAERLKRAPAARPIVHPCCAEELTRLIRGLLAQREPIYLQAHHIVECGSRSPDEIAKEIVHRLC